MPFLSTPFLLVLIIFFGERRRNAREFCSLIASCIQFLSVYLLLPKVLQGVTTEVRLIRLYPAMDIVLMVDPFSTLFAMLSSFLWIVITCYSIFYMRCLHEKNQTRYYFFFGLSVLAALGVAYSGNLFTLFMFYELLTFFTYPLVVHKETDEARRAGRKYLFYLFGGALLSALSMALLYISYERLDFANSASLSIGGRSTMLFLGLFFGFGVKAALLPIHEWLPSAMVAPTPVSALLHAVAVVKAGVFSILRVLLFLFDYRAMEAKPLHELLLWFIFLSIIVSNLLAITQSNLKRRLAFSTINNLCIVTFGALLFDPHGLKGAILHMPFHSFLKIALFMCAGIIYSSSKREGVEEMDGIGKTLPFTMGCFFLASLGIAGIPPISGFWSKWYLCLAALRTGRYLFLFGLLLNALLDVFYLFPIAYRGFFCGGEGTMGQERRSLLGLVALCLCIAFSILFFFAPNAFFRFVSLSDLTVYGIFGEGR